jgi:hypothetical protein
MTAAGMAPRSMVLHTMALRSRVLHPKALRSRVLQGMALSLVFLGSAGVSSPAAGGAPAGADPAGADLDGVMRSLAARQHGEAQFVERHYLSLVKSPLVSSGTLVYDAPDRLEKRTVLPRAETLVLKGHVLTVERGRRRRELDLQSYPEVAPLVEGLRATLAGDRAALEQAFHVQFTGGAAHWTLLLSPVDARASRTVSAIRIEGAADQLLEVDIRQADGDRSVMTLQTTAVP